MQSTTQPKGSDSTADATSAGMMQAVVQHAYGSANELQLADISKPTNVGADEVLVRVRAAAIDQGTVHLMTGEPYLVRMLFGLRRPKNQVPGLDLAGTVVAVGSAVIRFGIGDEVFGIGKGSLAEYGIAKADKLAHKPGQLTFEQAAAVPVSGLTAIQALRDAGQLTAGQKVLVIGASGGVGTYAVQLAKQFGADVTGVCSTSKVDLVKRIGADHVLDYTRQDVTGGDERYDVIVDIVGNTKVSRLRKLLTRTGTLVLVGVADTNKWTGGMGRNVRAALRSLGSRQRVKMFMAKEHYADLEKLGAILERGGITPTVERTYPLTEAPDALRHLQSGQARGKVVITVSPASTEH
jgi:NADPH:quinone reductase-like Zn-dependent oxidoreductase